MAIYLRGTDGLKTSVMARRNTLANRLLNDDRRKARGERSGTLSRTDRIKIQGEIGGLNTVILLIEDCTILTEDEYDKQFGTSMTEVKTE